MATVYEDKRGPYVKAGGWLFRPVFPVGYKHVFPAGTSFKAGDRLPPATVVAVRWGQSAGAPKKKHGTPMGLTWVRARRRTNFGSQMMVSLGSLFF